MPLYDGKFSIYICKFGKGKALAIWVVKSIWKKGRYQTAGVEVAIIIFPGKKNPNKPFYNMCCGFAGDLAMKKM